MFTIAVCPSFHPPPLQQTPFPASALLSAMHFFSSKVQSPAPRTRPHTIRFRALIGALFALLCLTLPAVNLHADETTAAETTIYNRAEATYADSTGLTFSIFSPTVSVTVRAVAMLAVTPDEAAPSASVTPRERITRLFQVCNTGNTADLYTLTGFTATAPAALVELRFDIDDSGTLTPADTLAALGSTMSPRVAPARCIGVLATLDTNDITQGSNLTLTLTARSNVQAIGAGAIDSGTIINTVGRPAQFTSPVDPTLQPLKLVEDQTRFTANQNQTLAYSIAFRNSGETIARNVVLRDPLPGNLTYVPGTLRLARTLTTNTNAVAKTLTDAEDSDEGTLRGATLELRLAEVAPAEIINLTFSARVTNSTPSSIGIVNTAELSASNASPIRSSDTIVIITPRGTIFAGRSGAPIAGANITLLDANLAAPVRTTPNIGNAPNEANDNPFASDANGNWSLVLTPDQLDQIGTQTTYRLRVAATNFRTRDLELTLTPTGGGLFTLTVRALDNQPISRFGSFELTTENVRADALSALAFNVPLFEASALELTKSVDKQNAEIGDTLSYRLEVQNRTSAALTALQIRDVLPRGFHYAEGTARIQSGATARPIEPQVTNQTLIFDLNSLAANSNATISYRVRIGADTAEGAASNTAIATATFPNGEPITTMQAVATVRVGRGVFSVRQVILGRVFDDVDGDNSFNAGDKPLAGVRLYLTNGQSATTDSQGMYNFPAVDDGALVISLDPITLPAGSQLLERDNNKRDRNSWTRLLRTPLGGGGLLRQNFAVRVNASAVADNIINSPRTANALVDDNDDAPNDAPQSGVARARDKGSSNAEISTLKSDVSNLAARRAGTYEEVSTEAVAIVAPGDVVVLNLTPDALVRTPALSVVARVAEGWTTQLKINNHPVPQENIGVQRQDHKNRVTTYEYVGIVLQPGANRVNIAAVSSAGKAATPKDFVVYGRAAARRMTIQPERSELRSDGRDATLLHIKLYDERGNPALDGTVTIEVSAGRLFAATFQNSSENPSVNSNDTNLTPTTTASNSASTSHRTGAKTSSSSTTNAPDRRNLETALTDNDANAIAVTDVPTRQMLIQTVDGEATVRLVAEGAPQKASIRSASGTLEAVSEIRFAPDVRPAILVGLAEASFGRAAPDNVLRGEDKAYRSHLSLFFRGKFLTDKNLLTLAYDSARPINRTTGASNRDRLFQLDPLDRVYPLFGDSSTRFDEARSNSKVYARLDRNRSFAQFGDFDTATVEPIAYSTRTQVDSATNFIANNALANANASAARLALYQRRLTGVQLHLENTRGDYVTLSGARPDTAWSRDIFQGGTLALIRLSHADMLLGSETVISETRDRRNPEIVIERTVLARSIDYNLDPLTGTIFFLRPTQSFDSQLNLVNTVVTYEHRADDYSSSVYTARAQTSSGIMRRLGLRAGVSAAVERRPEGFGNYTLGGIDIEKSLPRKGTARFEFATSRGTLDLSAGFLNTSLTPGDEALTRTVGQAANGNAFRFELTQPLGFYQATLRADYTRTGQGFFNPFGSTQAAGSSRAAVLFDMRPRASSTVRFSFTNERNQTANVDNSRTTVSALYTEQLNDKLRLGVGLDHREFNDTTNDKEVSSNLVTVGAEYRPTEKLEITAKREQNISDADPTYPDATTLTARYQINPAARLFFTQRLASAPIVPIADLVSTGFAGTGSRRETAVGIETQIGRATAVNGRYQIENGINGTDSFAVIGLTNRLSISKQFSLDTAFERGFLLAGNGESFTGGSFGLGWQAGDNFRSSARYEVRDRNGLGQIFTIGAAGKIGDDLTTLARFQMGRTTTDGGTRNGAAIEDRHNSVMQATAALAYRPLHNDRAALLFSYTHRSLEASGIAGREPVSDIADTLSADGLYQLRPDTEIYGRFALRRSADGRDDVAYVSTMTYMTQARLAQRIGSRFDVAGEARFLFQPVTSSYRESLGAEVGYWLLPDLRIGGGYNLTSLSGSATTSADNFFGARRGFYFTISSKLSNLFNLFGTSRAGLDGTTTPAATTAAAPEQQIERDGRQ